MAPTVLLVHGAMHTPWIFEPLRERLAARAVTSTAVQLPSSNPDSAATGGLADDVATVREAVAAVGGPVVLAAHSYGGVPLPFEAPTRAQGFPGTGRPGRAGSAWHGLSVFGTWVTEPTGTG